ncbi:hypothetical protein Tdes44962_MAKER10060 [Teratosphaeria destructans]|uniref:Uncharacterized protein n=1 Tax=Teratosphaeria destructans TaxID=418781 RepID=A0A9W7SP74_9PEZI|nr:hypothetical protein Tdes44962_MAKER10060 [Teratosphaeria destructans]
MSDRAGRGLVGLSMATYHVGVRKGLVTEVRAIEARLVRATARDAREQLRRGQPKQRWQEEE